MASTRITMITTETRCLVFLLFMLNMFTPNCLLGCMTADLMALKGLYMFFFLLASSILLGFIIARNIKTQKKRKAHSEESFWERERRANSTRRKPIDGLNYITIPLETFPTHILQQDQVVSECISTLETLTSQKILNLTGFSNTDLKLEYGTANINVLSEYDQNYTLLVRTLQKWADVLIDTGYMEEASVLMEFAISTGTDVSRTYYELAKYYASQGETEQIKRLKGLAGALRSSSGKIILRSLNKDYPEC